MTATIGHTALRARLATELLAILPELKRVLQAAIPDELRDELANATPHQLEALGLLHRLDGRAAGATMQEVARAQGCALSTATALVDRLIKQGLAERAPDAGDRRVVKILPTERARELLEKFVESRRRVALAALAGLDDDDARELIRLLRMVTMHEPAGAEVAHG